MPPAAAPVSALVPGSAPDLDLPPELAHHPRYRIVKLLGKGGMGVVYQAVHLLMERMVALKVISRFLTSHPAAVERFRREVKLAARLAHPNIVTAFDAEQAGDTHFLVMEFVPGINLDQLVEKRGRLPIGLACKFIRQTAAGLQHAFEQGLVHRDIKPSNLLLAMSSENDLDGATVKITDFGLARLGRPPDLAEASTALGLDKRGGQGVTGSGIALGTPGFMAPEQAIDSRRADIRSDIYSLGCTLYFLLVGHDPFPEGTTMEVLVSHLKQTPQSLTTIRNDVPQELVAIVARMMAKDPADRYQSPAEVAAVLAPFEDWAVASPILNSQEQRDAAKSSLPATETGAVLEPKARGFWSPRRVVGAILAAAIGIGGLTALSLHGINRADKTEITTAQKDDLALKTVLEGLPKARVLFVLPQKNFWYADFAPVRKLLDLHGVEVRVASSTREPAKPDPRSPGPAVPPDLLLSDAQAADFDAVIFCGGIGFLEYTGETPGGREARRLIRAMLDADKYVTALGMGPAILADAGVLKAKYSTCDRAQLDKLGPKVSAILSTTPPYWTDRPVESQGRIITGRNSEVAEEFTHTLLSALGRQIEALPATQD